MTKHDDTGVDTKLVYLGRDPKRDCGSVNPPVHRTSTVIFPDYAAFRDYNDGKLQGFRSYGRFGSPTTDGLEEALAALEGADHAITTGSGLAAITTTLLAFLNAGDHALFPDSIYGSANEFINHELVRLGVEVQFYDPTIGAGIAALMKPNTKVVYCESPGSLTFEMQDVPAIAKVAHAGGAVVIADNTWATPLNQKPFALGADISIHSASKYIGGHSDLVMGVALCKKEHWPRLRRMHRNLGAATSGDNAYLALRGLRTIAVRLKEHEAHAMEVAEWLQNVPEVKRILFPALPGDPGHALWKRDMTGACGLFAVELTQANDAALSAMIDGLQHFGVGFSWGGYESLITAYKPYHLRKVTKWDTDATFLRLHIGLEAPKDLIADLDAGFARLRAALKGETGAKASKHVAENGMDASWRGWVKENLERGCKPVEIRDILLDRKFSLPVIKKEMGAQFPHDGLQPALSTIDYEALTRIKITRTAKRFETDLLQLYVLDDFMTAKECDQLVAITESSLRPSTITTQETETDKYFRTSSTSDLAHIKHKLIDKIDQKIAKTIGINLSYSEGIQAQRYEVGQQFKAHTDYFEPGTKEFEKFAGTQGNRTWTFMVYLNDTPKGGGTHFVNIDHIFYPKKGTAVIWNNLDAEGCPNRNTLHSGMPVEEGCKIVITKWFRELGKGEMIAD